MENATKALLIAGAVAVTLLILSLGMYFYNSATEGINLDKLSQAQKDEFNQEFLMYEGNAVSGSQVNTLIQRVINSNTNETAEESGKTITLNMSKTGVSAFTINPDGTASVTNPKVPTGYTYKVSVTIGQFGLVDTITIN